jgi:hypothetical protein
MTVGTQYHIKAKIKVDNADGLTKIGTWLQDEAAYPDTKTSYQAAITPTSEFVEYEWYFTPSDWSPTRIVFCTGLFGGKVYFDDVTCVPTSGSGELVDNGNINNPDISNWESNYGGPSYTRWDYEETINVTSAGFTTFSHKKNINVDGVVTAYKAKYEGGKVVLTPVTEIPAGAGVIVEAAEGTYTVPAINSASALDGNELLVSDGSVAGNGSIYALGKKGGVVGFAKVKSGATVPAGKAYLLIPAASRDFFGFGEDEATGIENLTPALSEGEGTVYDLQGRRVAQPTKGLYIVNGKKVLVK